MPIESTLAGRSADLGGGFVVRRLLPSARLRSVGPFIFFDHFGPVTEHPCDNHDVRPHPHIGLATVTYLFEGAMMHRDSLGTAQLIEPGAINWMTAGRGITHSERKPETLKDATFVNHGLQLWVALPRDLEESEPSFTHTPAAAIPELTVGGARIRLLAGELLGTRSPVKTPSPTLYLDVQLAPGGACTLPIDAQEAAVYAIGPGAWVDGAELAAQSMALLTTAIDADSSRQTVLANSGDKPLRLVVVGGDALDAPRHMWWNFASSRKERIDQAAEDWRAGRFTPVPGESEFIPLPER